MFECETKEGQRQCGQWRIDRCLGKDPEKMCEARKALETRWAEDVKPPEWGSYCDNVDWLIGEIRRLRMELRAQKMGKNTAPTAQGSGGEGMSTLARSTKCVKGADPIVEKAARKLFAIERVPPKEQTRMVRRALQVVADEVGRLRAELAQTRLEEAEANAKTADLTWEAEEYSKEITRLRAENERLCLELAALDLVIKQLRAENERMRGIIEKLIYASDNCQGHAGCSH